MPYKHLLSMLVDNFLKRRWATKQKCPLFDFVLRCSKGGIICGKEINKLNWEGINQSICYGVEFFRGWFKIPDKIISFYPPKPIKDKTLTVCFTSKILILTPCAWSNFVNNSGITEAKSTPPSSFLTVVLAMKANLVINTFLKC